jgi:hypothetical protein
MEILLKSFPAQSIPEFFKISRIRLGLMKSTFNLCSELRCHEEPSIPVPRVCTESRRFARRMAEATPTHNRSPNQTILNVGLRGMSAWTLEFRSFTNYKEMQGLLVLVDKKN